ncbi:LysM peptidoglycan-binding domain-containing protein [Pontibacter sp. G13]|uniref:LysM peptidoglycan-binding domain-containing protein n=1 Tax=Pontibacter sp. G13 TaxID=3074898 RepID=UPI00288A5549|nr:LysM peptidoglycan-binding domain-containing protein [Pontibacter sp. G13]WNJ21214.1 LysM peptidoglycan-binding domain-containing protein [Pontibacter sp. G13]
MKRILVLMFASIGWMSLSFGQEVPNQVSYCGIELELDKGAQKHISELVSNIKSSPRYFNEMVQRAALYMPFVFEAFDRVGVPRDIAYLSIQESGLRPAVVSSSKAVGFWQIKEATGLELGLVIDDRIDERKHIYRASEAAASYFQKANLQYDNWAYAVLAYYEGPSGSVKFTDAKYYGKSRMKIDKDFHWYVLKAIAHKLAYGEAVQELEKPEMWLVPKVVSGETQARKIAKAHHLDESTFLKYNRWILNGKKIAKEQSYTYYIPEIGDHYPGHAQDPLREPLEGPSPELGTDWVSTDIVVTDLSESPEDPELENPTDPNPTDAPTLPAPEEEPINFQPYSALDAGVLEKGTYATFEVSKDLHHDLEYVQYDGRISLRQIAMGHDVEYGELLVWNEFLPNQAIKLGTIVYLNKRKKVKYHIVQRGETLLQISDRYSVSLKTIQKRNWMAKGDLRIYVGQKLYLRKMKPEGERMIILTDRLEPQDLEPETPVITEIEETPIDPITPEEPATPNPIDELIIRNPVAPEEEPENSGTETPTQPESRWVQHTVKEGETLWRIAQLYGTKVEVIKRINKLPNDNISPGQTLRILMKVEEDGQ